MEQQDNRNGLTGDSEWSQPKPTRITRVYVQTINCPWCGRQCDVPVEIGAVNINQSGGDPPRRTSLTSRRTESVYHECADARV
jgi:hypothetical protein